MRQERAGSKHSAVAGNFDQISRQKVPESELSTEESMDLFVAKCPPPASVVRPKRQKGAEEAGTVNIDVVLKAKS